MKAIRVCIVIFMVLCIISLLMTTILFLVRENEKAKRIKLEEHVSQLNTTIVQLNGKVSQLQDDNKALEGDVDEQKSLVDSYKLKLRQQKKIVAEKNEQVEELETELESVRDSFSSYKLSSSSMLDEYKEQNTTLLERVSRLEQAKQYANTYAYEDTTETPMISYDQSYPDTYDHGAVELEPVVVRGDTTIRGKVEVVNRNFNFVVSNIGRSDGVAIGDSLTVTRDGRYVAQVHVEKLYENLSASAIDDENVNDPIQEGDTIERQ